MVNHSNLITIAGISASTPKETLAVDDSNLLSTIEKRTLKKLYNVKRVHKSKNYTTYDLCLHATERLLKRLDWQNADIDFLISVTQTPNYIMPSNASLYHQALALKKDCMVFEINAGCTGFVQALIIASNFLLNPNLKKGLVLTGETTYNVSTTDKASYPFMGDAGTATAVVRNSESEILHYNSITDGDYFKAIHVPGGAGNFYKTSNDDVLTAENLKVSMHGEMVKDFIFLEAMPTISAFVSDNKIDKKNIDYYVFHQVNKVLLTGMAKKLNIDSDKMLTCTEEYGNTSSASIPLCICHHHQLLNDKTLNLFLSGFGIGMANINLFMPNFKSTVLPINHI